jgi:hypothetical protein
VIDTSVLVAGISGLNTERAPGNPSAELLRDWLENATFAWLITEDILAEYKEVLRRLGVRRNLISTACVRRFPVEITGTAELHLAASAAICCPTSRHSSRRDGGPFVERPKFTVGRTGRSAGT